MPMIIPLGRRIKNLGRRIKDSFLSLAGLIRRSPGQNKAPGLWISQILKNLCQSIDNNNKLPFWMSATIFHLRISENIMLDS